MTYIIIALLLLNVACWIYDKNKKKEGNYSIDILTKDIQLSAKLPYDTQCLRYMERTKYSDKYIVIVDMKDGKESYSVKSSDVDAYQKVYNDLSNILSKGGTLTFMKTDDTEYKVKLLTSKY